MFLVYVILAPPLLRDPSGSQEKGGFSITPQYHLLKKYHSVSHLGFHQ